VEGGAEAPRVGGVPLLAHNAGAVGSEDRISGVGLQRAATPVERQRRVAGERALGPVPPCPKGDEG
jgi:hypothetical protein